MLPVDTELGMEWSQLKQVFYCANELFSNEGRTNTDPSHDLSHLLIAACEKLPWKPTNDSRLRRLAEFNAVFIEHLLDEVYNCIVYRSSDSAEIVPKTIDYAKWFVDVHYAPFPVTFEEAYRDFACGIDAPTIVRLSPYFFWLKEDERTNSHLLCQTNNWKTHQLERILAAR